VRFWDASALLPLVARQDSSPEVRRWIARDAGLVLWTLTPVEIVSAVRRLVREERLDEARGREACLRAAELAARAHLVRDVERVKPLAVRLLHVHALRAADALQLGAALLWADGAPAGRMLHTLDRRLGLAALREGFAVLPEPDCA
jgi:predicted nucleic acid-binding protein